MDLESEIKIDWYFEAVTSVATTFEILSLFCTHTIHAGQWPAVDNGWALVHQVVFNETASVGWNSAWQLGSMPVSAHWPVARFELMTRPTVVGGWEIERGSCNRFSEHQINCNSSIGQMRFCLLGQNNIKMVDVKTDRKTTIFWKNCIKGPMSWPFLLIIIPLLRSTRICVFTLCTTRLVGAPAPPPLSPLCSD